jgi:hypothetical protein
VKVPSSKGAKELTKQLESADARLGLAAGKLYRQLLRTVVVTWTEVSGDSSLEQAIRSWDIPRMLSIADDLVGQKYPTAASHFAAHQLAALIRKYPWTEQQSGMDPELTARLNFLRQERRMAKVNRWFQARARRSLQGGDLQWEGYLHRSRQWIRYVLRDAPNLPRIYGKCDFTSGANVGVSGDLTNLARKLLANVWTVTPSARPYFAAALSANFHYASRTGANRGDGRQCLQVQEQDLDTCTAMVDYNKVGFVLKTAKTHRVMASEPLGNNLVQKGTDLEMRDLLRRVGLDLRWQHPNQEMAREGSLSDTEEGFVTIDLKDASNSVSIGLCRTQLPPDWFRFLDAIRSPAYKLPGCEGVTRYQMFVSMGNGFCFPLQTLLFASLVHAVDTSAVPGVDFRVYGDDIVVRKKIAPMLIRLLARVGFKTNSRKTFVEGPFRESCGSNWYNGEDVTPMTLDYALDSIGALFKFINLSRRNVATSHFLEDARRLVLSRVPDQFLFHRPYKGRPDTGIDPLGLELPAVWDRHSAWQCPEWYELHTVPVSDSAVVAHHPMGKYESSPGWVVMAAALRGHPSSKPFVRRRAVSTRVQRTARSNSEMEPSQDYVHLHARSPRFSLRLVRYR